MAELKDLIEPLPVHLVNTGGEHTFLWRGEPSVLVSADVFSDPVLTKDAGGFFYGQLQAVWTGNLVGMCTIELSNDCEHWTKLSLSTGFTVGEIMLGGSAGDMCAYLYTGSKWLRACLTYTSGSGRLSAVIHTQAT